MVEFISHDIKEALCKKKGLRLAASYERPNDKSRLQDLLEYTFGNSKIAFSDYSLGPFGLMNYTSFAEDNRFLTLVVQNHQILQVVKWIKQIYESQIIPECSSELEFIEHMKGVVKILNLELELPPAEFLRRAEELKKNLLNEKRTYVPEKILNPKFYAEQRERRRGRY